MVFRVKNFVNNNSRTISKIDPSLFLWYHESDELIGYILVQADDFLFAGNKDLHKTIITILGGTFLTGKEDKLNFKYLQLNVTSTNSTVTIKHYQYIHITVIHKDHKKDPTSPLNKAEKDQLSEKIECDKNNIKWIKSSDQLADILRQSANSLSLIKALDDGFIYVISPRITIKDLTYQCILNVLL